MAKIPIKLIKDHGPKLAGFAKNHWKEVVMASPVVIKKVQEFQNQKDNRTKEKDSLGKLPYRKSRYRTFNQDILRNLDSKNRAELFKYKQEVEQYILQINKEEENEVYVKRPLHSKRVKNWSKILVQIEDKMALKDYQEFLFMFHNPGYKSKYFEGFEGLENKFKEALEGDREGLYKFLIKYTNKTVEEIDRDFS